MNAVTTKPANSLLLDPATFDQLWRVGRLLSMTLFFPEHLRKGSPDQAIANGVLVADMAARLGEHPMTVAQNIYFVGGRPGWSASYMIAKANQHGVFRDPIDWEVCGTGPSLSVTAFAVLAKTGRKVSVTCDMKMATAEGWTKNSKYQSIPEQMLRYRSATFLIRLYCPEIMIGVPSQVEIETAGMKDVTPDDQIAAVFGRGERQSAETAKPAETQADSDKSKQADAKETVADVVDADVVAAEASRPREIHTQAYDQITQDLIDGAPVAATKQHFKDELAAMEKGAPDLFDQIQKEFEAADNPAA